MSGTYTLPNYVDGRWVVAHRTRAEIVGLCKRRGLTWSRYGRSNVLVRGHGAHVHYDASNGHFWGFPPAPLAEFDSGDIGHLHAPWFFALCGFFWVLAPITRFSPGMEHAMRLAQTDDVTTVAKRTGYMRSEIDRALEIRAAETLGQAQLPL